MKEDKKKELAEKMNVPLQWVDTLDSTDDLFPEAIAYLEDMGLVKDRCCLDDRADDGDNGCVWLCYDVGDREGLVEWCNEYGVEYRISE